MFSYIILVHILSTFAAGIPLSEYNETNLLLSINSRLTDLKAETDRQAKLIDVLVRTMNIQDHENNLMDALAKATDLQTLRAEFQALKEELKVSPLRTELERQGKLLDGFCNKSNLNICTKVKSSGVYDILVPNFSCRPFKVACDADHQGGGWTVILKRIDGSVDFYRNWTEYKNGFGDLNGEFFLGLDKIHAITTERTQELLVVVEDFEEQQRYELYDAFGIGNEREQYVLHTLGNSNGTAGDSLKFHHGSKFSTFDRDNDSYKNNCAVQSLGAWWYYICHYSNLAGKYNDNASGHGVNWVSFRERNYSLKKAVMMLRPRK